MRFADLCDSKLLARVGEKQVRKNSMGEWCYALEQLKLLSEIILNQVDTVDDLLIETYYMADDKIMEAYWYHLSIRVVGGEQNREKYFLSTTGKKRIEDIGEDTLDLLRNTYFEISVGDKHSFVGSLEQWIDYMAEQESKLIHEERSREIYGEIKDDGVYYALL